MRITDQMIRQGHGTVVAVDAGVLLAYVRASRELHDFIHSELPSVESRPAEWRMERWELAHATLCGNLGQ